MLTRACMFCAAALAMPASGAILEVRESFNFPFSQSRKTVWIPEFNTQGGARTLTNAIVHLEMNIWADVAVENLAPHAAVRKASAGYTYTWGYGGNYLAGLSSPNVMLGANNGVPGSGPDFHNFGRLDYIAAETHRVTYLPWFTGTGHFPFRIAVTGPGFTDRPGVAAYHVADFRVTGSVRVVYSYIPAPASAIALGAGLVLVRRRRS